MAGRRAQALLAMLATSNRGERTRIWLQDRLWGSRAAAQAQASLRRELSSLRKLVNRDGAELLCADQTRIWLDLDLIAIDLHDTRSATHGEFLEGFDLPGEEGFEDWLREERARFCKSGAPYAEQNTHISAHGGLSSIAIGEITGAAKAADALADRFARINWLRVLSGPGEKEARFELNGHINETGATGALITLKLKDRITGRLLWSDGFSDHGVADPPPSVIDEAVSAVRARIAQAEQITAMAIPDEQLNQAGLIWKSQWHMHRLTRKDAARAVELAKLALDADPDGTEPIVQRTWVRLWDLWVTRGDEAAIREVREMAQRAIIADHEDARGHLMAGIAEIWLMQPLRAEALLRRAVALDPTLIMARVQLACALIYAQPKLLEARAELDISLRLSPNDQYLFFIEGELATTCLMQDKWEESLVHAETSLAARRSYGYGHVAKINALVRLGRMKEAHIAYKELYRANPHFRYEFIDWIPFLDSTWHVFLREGLNQAAAASD